MSDSSSVTFDNRRHHSQFSLGMNDPLLLLAELEGDPKESVDSMNHGNSNPHQNIANILVTTSFGSPNPFEVPRNQQSFNHLYRNNLNTVNFTTMPTVDPSTNAAGATPAQQNNKMRLESPKHSPHSMQLDSPVSSPRSSAVMPPPQHPTTPTHAKRRTSMEVIVETTSVQDSMSPLSSPIVQRSVLSGMNIQEEDLDEEEDNGGNHKSNKSRRQKRLERNRESARLSRRRRKQYLEVLEERVSQLSEEMDRGRRAHVAVAVSTIIDKRRTSTSAATAAPLARTSQELRVACTFRAQQLASFCTPPSHKLVLWLTLQNDDFFRGGRAASERLSAARIGERMLQSGNDKVTPAQTMWPLLCNEIGLSYDQEEKVRLFQRSLVCTQPESWLSRHATFASSKVVDVLHQANQALAFAISHRERRVTSMFLSRNRQQQRAKLSAYVLSHRKALLQKANQHAGVSGNPDKMDESSNSKTQNSYVLSKEQHVAANLYILRHRLSQILKTVLAAAPLVVGPALKKLSRRPSFESLGSRSGTEKKEYGDNLSSSQSMMHRVSSMGSLKRSASEMSMDSDPNNSNSTIAGNSAGDRHHRLSVDPVEAQSKAVSIVQQHLSHVREIMPPFNVPIFSIVPSAALSSPPREAMGPQVSSSNIFVLQQPPAQPQTLARQPLQYSQHQQPLVNNDHLSQYHHEDVLAVFGLMGGQPALLNPVPVTVTSSFSSTPSAGTQGPTVTMAVQSSSAEHPARDAAAFYHNNNLPLFNDLVDVDHAVSNNVVTTAGSADPEAEPEPQQKKRAQRAQSSFFPIGSLGVVPEEMWSAEAADEFLMSLVNEGDEEDWTF